MPTITRFVAKYPKSSAIIHAVQQDSTSLPVHNPNEIVADTWEAAHERLQEQALQGYLEAAQAMSAALKHVGDVMAMAAPTAP